MSPNEARIDKRRHTDYRRVSVIGARRWFPALRQVRVRDSRSAGSRERGAHIPARRHVVAKRFPRSLPSRKRPCTTGQHPITVSPVTRRGDSRGTSGGFAARSPRAPPPRCPLLPVRPSIMRNITIGATRGPKVGVGLINRVESESKPLDNRQLKRDMASSSKPGVIEGTSVFVTMDLYARLKINVYKRNKFDGCSHFSYALPRSESYLWIKSI